MPGLEEQPPFRVLIVGGSYSGLAATLNLVDLCHGRKCRFNQDENDQGPGTTIPVQVTIVDERDGYCMWNPHVTSEKMALTVIILDHLIGLPLAIASNADASMFWKKFADIPALQSPDINHIQGRVDSIDCKSRIARIRQNTANDGHKIVEEKYDYMIACSGLRREWPSAPKSLTREAYLAETADSVQTIEKAVGGVAVIGGGM